MSRDAKIAEWMLLNDDPEEKKRSDPQVSQFREWIRAREREDLQQQKDNPHLFTAAEITALQSGMTDLVHLRKKYPDLRNNDMVDALKYAYEAVAGSKSLRPKEEDSVAIDARFRARKHISAIKEARNQGSEEGGDC